jgi:hypothetical protein
MAYLPYTTLNIGALSHVLTTPRHDPPVWPTLFSSLCSLNAIVAQPKNCPVSFQMWEPHPKIIAGHPARCVSTNKCAGIVGCSCYISEVNPSINSKLQFLDCVTMCHCCIQWATYCKKLKMAALWCPFTKLSFQGSCKYVYSFKFEIGK